MGGLLRLMGSKVYRYGGKGRSRSGAGRPAKKIGWGWFVLPVLVTLPVLWLLWPRGAEQPQEPAIKAVKAPKAVKEVKPSKGSQGLKEPQEVTKPVPRAEREPLTAHSTHVPPSETTLSVVTNKSGYIVERVRLPDGRIQKRVIEPPPIFHNASDQMIALALSAPQGQSLPPMPANAVSDEDFMQSLNEKIEILDTDSDEVKDLKAKVIVAREDIRAMMKKGYTAMQVLQEHHELFNDNAKLHTDALMEMNGILASGDRAEARKYATTMNEAFRQMGVLELPIPSEDGSEEAKARAERKENLKAKLRQRKAERK